jgi:hypothetical protein
MEDEAPPRLNRATVMNGAIRRLAGVEIQLFQESAEPETRALVADSDSDRAIFVMDAHRNHRPLEARIGHAGHCEQQLA